MRFNKIHIIFGILFFLAAFMSCSKGLPSLPAPRLTIAEQNDTSFTVCWEKVENADSYSYRFNNGVERHTTESSMFFSYLETGGTYKVEVKANAPEGSDVWSDSHYSVIEITLEEFDPNKVLQQWVGTWTATSKKALEWRYEPPVGGGNPIRSFLIDSTLTTTFSMEIDPEHSDVLLIHGWSYLEYPAYAKVSEDRQSIEVYAGIVVKNNGTTNPRWCSYIEVPEDRAFGHIVVEHVAYRLIKNGDIATAVPAEGDLDGGKTFKVRHFGVYGYVAGQGVTLIGGIMNLPFSLLADEITLTRESL